MGIASAESGFVCIMMQNIAGLKINIRGKNFSRQHFEMFLLFFQENRLWHFMQIVFLGDNSLHEMQKPILLEK